MVSRIYDRVAHTFDSDWSGIYSRSRRINVNQILEHIDVECLERAVDFAVGTGNAFRDLSQHIKIEERLGLDISNEMLKCAAEKLKTGFTGICDNLLNIGNHIAPASQDLVLCHFIMGFVQPEDVLKRAFEVLKPGGFISIASTTQQALSEIHTDYFPFTAKVLKVNAAVNEMIIPKDHKSFEKKIQAHGFELIASHNDRPLLSFNSADDVYNWAIHSGWAATYFNRYYWVKRIGSMAWLKAAELMLAPLYPVTANNDISLILAQRPYEANVQVNSVAV